MLQLSSGGVMIRKPTYVEMEQQVVELQQANAMQGKILGNILPVCVTDKEYVIILTNTSYNTIFGKPAAGMRCFESRSGSSCHTEKCPLRQILQGEPEYTCEAFKKGEGGELDRIFIVRAKPLFNDAGEPVGVIESFQDITRRKEVEEEKKVLIEELQAALAKVNVLSGFLPICASCKKIRDDKGYWNQIESYIRDHSEAEFSHSICPDCVKKLYPDLKIS